MRACRAQDFKDKEQMPDEASNALIEIRNSLKENVTAVKLIHNDLEGLRGGLANLQTQRQQDSTTMRTGVQELRQDFATMQTGVQELRQDFATMQTGVHELRQDFATMQTDVRELRQDFATMQTDVRELRQDSTTVRTGVQELRNDLQALRTTTDGISAEHSRTRSEIMSRIDRLQETVELTRDDARVNWATADTAINRVRNSREDIDDLQKQIAAMERRYQTMASVVDGLRKPAKPDNQ
jgi:chromosome segregation ATPase